MVLYELFCRGTFLNYLFIFQKVYQQVLVLDLEYAINRKIEQDLWNLGFKNYIDALQKLVKDKKVGIRRN